MKIRVLQSFSVYKKNQEFDWPAGMARIFLARGLIEKVLPKQPEIEHATAEIRSEKAVIKKTVKRRRGKKC